MIREVLLQHVPALAFRDAILPVFASAYVTFCIFHRYEMLPVLPTFVLLVVLPQLSALTLIPHFNNVSTALLTAFSIYYSTILLAIVLYRLSPFHPLASYPGPLLPKISRLYLYWLSMQGKQHLWYKKMHDKYGSCIRVGPNELSMADAESIASILGPKGMAKGPMYDGRVRRNTDRSLIITRDPHERARRRKLWARAFTAGSIKDYEPAIDSRISGLVGQLGRFASSEDQVTPIEVDLAEWVGFFTFDFMGDMAFGGGFNITLEGDKYGFWDMFENGVLEALTLEHIPWVSLPLQYIPGMVAKTRKFREFAAAKASERIQKGSVSKDLFYYLLHEVDGEAPPPLKTVIADAALAIGAGSDTTSTVLSHIFYYMCLYPEVQAKLRAEVDRAFPQRIAELDARKLAEMDYLNSVINEALRLEPPVSSRIQRAPLPGSGGHWVGDIFIPEGIAVQIPPYVVHRDPRYFFPKPEAFWPERWLSASTESGARRASEKINFVTDLNAFIPFSFGPENCVGKSLAILEMRMVLTRVTQHFEFRFADSYDPEAWWNEREDFYIAKVGRLPVLLAKRD